MTVLAFTGHRKNKPWWGWNNPEMDNKIYKEIKNKLLELKPKKAISGMALGVDQLAANACIELGIPFIAAVPHIGQEAIWPKASQEKYKEILSKAEEVAIVCEGGYASWKPNKRNEWMCDHCDVLLAIFDGSSGGTFNCVNYAKSKGKAIIEINPTKL